MIFLGCIRQSDTVCLEIFINFSITISYGRYCDDIPAPAGVNTSECDLCMNTLYVKPDAAELFDGCQLSQQFQRVHVAIFTHMEGYTTAVFGGYFTNTTQLYGFTSRGMMCKCLWIKMFAPPPNPEWKVIPNLPSDFCTFTIRFLALQIR